MNSLIGTANWEAFKRIVKAGSEEFSKKVITHLVWEKGVDIHHEGEEVGSFTSRELMVLQNHNYMRTWPISKASEAGELDKQSVQIFINKRYLQDKGWITANDNYDYNPDMDRFLIDGITYKAFGDTGASQASDEDLFYLIILKREESNTNQFKVR